MHNANVMNITKEQIKSLILNAYGFMSKYNSLHFCQEDYVHNETFELVDIDGECYELTYNNASVCNGSVTFEEVDGGKLVRFTILIVPTDGSGLMPELLQNS